MKLAVIGGGPAGMAAAVSAREKGIEDVVLIERHDYLGGVLPQCIHTGFGTQLYEKDYTGGEYAWLWVEKTADAGVRVMTSATVLSVDRADAGSADPENPAVSADVETSADSLCKAQVQQGKSAGQAGGSAAGPEFSGDRPKWHIKCVSSVTGAADIYADAVIVATGCRERTLPQMLIPGSRPAGVFTAGSAQLMMNMKNYLPGRSAVILGSGDIGLIMARRMTLEGIRVKMILGQEATGLARNIIQCVEDFDIPMRYGWTLVSTHGYKRLKGVTIAPFGEDGRPAMERREYIPCDTLLVAAGLIPELEVIHGYTAEGAGNGLFVCGNASGVHDLADHVTEEGIRTGVQAASYLLCKDIDMPQEAVAVRPEATGRRGNMICTVCPKGCVMQVESEPFSVSGNECQRGASFAKQELQNPERVLTSVAGTDDPAHPVLPVRTSRTIDKSRIYDVMKAVKRIRVSGSFRPGDIVAENIAGTGADLIATWYTGRDSLKNGKKK